MSAKRRIVIPAIAVALMVLTAACSGNEDGKDIESLPPVSIEETPSDGPDETTSSTTSTTATTTTSSTATTEASTIPDPSDGEAFDEYIADLIDDSSPTHVPDPGWFTERLFSETGQWFSAIGCDDAGRNGVYAEGDTISIPELVGMAEQRLDPPRPASFGTSPLDDGASSPRPELQEFGQTPSPDQPGPNGPRETEHPGRTAPVRAWFAKSACPNRPAIVRTPIYEPR